MPVRSNNSLTAAIGFTADRNPTPNRDSETPHYQYL